MRSKRIFLIILTIGLFFYLLYWFLYKRSMDKVNEEWYKEAYVNKRIEGVVENIVVFNGDSSKITLSIEDNNSELKIRYGVTCVDRSFWDFVSIGDSVFKDSGIKKIEFCRTSSQFKNCKNIELNFCNEFE